VVAHAAAEQAVGVRVGVETPPADAGGSDPQSGEQLDEYLGCLLTLVARALSRAYTPQIFSKMSRTSSRPFSPEHRPSDDQDRAVLDVVKALAALDPAGCGLDDASAQLEVALM
jgi:hypothetical protein